MKFNHLNWECGSGKTDTLLAHIAANPGRYIVALNRIDLFSQQQARLKTFSGSSSIETTVIHSKDGVRKMPVVGRINDYLESQNNNNASHCALFITHEALLLVDWRRKDLQANKWNLFIDESPSVWKFVEKNCEISHDEFLAYIAPKPAGEGETEDADFTRVQATEKGEALRRSKKDALNAVFNDMLNAISGARCGFANRDFFTPTAAGTTSRKLKIFSIIDPDAFGAFNEATILAANFEQTFTYLLWKAIGVEFQHRTDFGTPPQRSVPLKDRIRIHYFSVKDAATNWFNKKANPLQVACRWVDENIKERFYYAVNNDKSSGNKLDLIRSNLATKIQPIASGSNDLRDFTAAVWLVALKAPPNEYRIIKLYGVDRDQYDRFREHEYLYQFAFRSNLREFNSDKVVDIYVVSKRQAEALQAITGAVAVDMVGNGLPDSIDTPDGIAQPVGRRPKYKTLEEKKAAKKAQGRLWKANKRKQEREARLRQQDS